MTADRVRPADRADLDGRGRPSPPDDLRRRLDNLPPGHPSSPRETDGTPRDPTPRLRDLDNLADAEVDSGSEPGDSASRPADKISPLSDAEWADHRVDVRTRVEKAQVDGLATNQQYTVDGKGQIWTVERATLHDAIINTLLAESSGVPCDHLAVIAGGLGGAGKSTVLDKHAGFDESQYLKINPDKIKEELAHRGAVPQIEGLTPMEASGLVHEEASYIAKQLAMRAQADGRNIIWDITMSKRESAEQRIDELRANGYHRIEGVFVDIPIDVSIERAESRHRQDHEKYRAGEGLGGRLVPEEVTRAQADDTWGSQNRRAFEEVKQRFDSWVVYDNSVNHRDPLLVATSNETRAEPEETSR
ncbi:MAG TPA: zeta toxin family protein [Streptosporangiaceae bacterium]